MERILRIAETYEIAEEIDLDDWLALSGAERLEIGERMRQEMWPDHEPKVYEGRPQGRPRSGPSREAGGVHHERGLQRLLRGVVPTRG
jgi:hypothetical protein